MDTIDSFSAITLNSPATIPINSSLSAPFDAGGDVILRSKDNVDFRTFKVILAMGSQVFSSMFQDGTESEIEDSLPVVRMDGVESSALRELLLFLHPGHKCEWSYPQEG